MKFLGKKSATLLVALLSVCTPAQARKGGIGDGGGEQVTAESNPWRVGPSPIEYCIQRADGFPQSRADLSQLVAESFRDWQAFFSKYEMNRPFRGSDTAAKYALPASAREVAACTDVRSQIRFLFGVTNAETLRYKARY
ncbi:hypothetical protein GWI34_44360, partial [Actinomadura sp. DSM 109109]|nr:hypothetical protein [Actinomadura lepetitiana]